MLLPSRVAGGMLGLRGPDLGRRLPAHCLDCQKRTRSCLCPIHHAMSSVGESVPSQKKTWVKSTCLLYRIYSSCKLFISMYSFVILTHIYLHSVIGWPTEYAFIIPTVYKTRQRTNGMTKKSARCHHQEVSTPIISCDNNIRCLTATVYICVLWVKKSHWVPRFEK